MSVFHVSSDLIEAVGLEQAIFLDGISKIFHQKCLNNIRASDGRVWVWTTDESLVDKAFPFWSRKTVMRIRQGLIASGVLRSGDKASAYASRDGKLPPNLTWMSFVDEGYWFEVLNVLGGRSKSKVPNRTFKDDPKVPSRTFKSPDPDFYKSQAGLLSLPLETPDLTPSLTPTSRDAFPGGHFVPALEPVEATILYPEVLTDKEAKPETGVQVFEDKKPRAPKKPATPSEGSVVWEAYSVAFENRYRFPPVRNAMANALCSQLVKRLGSEAPEVAAFYLLHKDSFYVRSNHALNLLVKDAEKLRTDWARGAQMTSSQAAQTDLRQANKAAFDEARELLRNMK